MSRIEKGIDQHTTIPPEQISILNTIGGKLDDEASTGTLGHWGNYYYDPSTYPYPEWAMTVKSLTQGVKANITRALGIWYRNGFETVGSIRNTSVDDLAKVKGRQERAGFRMASFIKVVFEKKSR